MTVLRRMTLFIVGAVAVAGVTVPAEGATEPTTLAVEGTLEVIAVDTFGADARADHLYTVVTDDGAEIPVDLDQDGPADGRFRGELVVAGRVADALDEKNLLPRSGSTIDEDTRAGQAAVAEAEKQSTPLTVASSTVSPATAAAVAPAAHRAYVAKMTGVGSVDGTDADITTSVNSMLDYWEAESGTVIPDFRRVGRASDPIPTFAAPPGVTTANGCGMVDPRNRNYVGAIWDAAADVFPSIDFSAPGNHLVVLAGEECGDSGPVGIAQVGSSIGDGGPSILTYDSQIFSQVGAHEIGHNFGLEHANLSTCSSSAACEYYDFYSVMGLGIGTPSDVLSPPALGSLYRSELGLPGPGEVTALSAAPGQSIDQTFSLSARGSSAGLRGVLVVDPATGVSYSVDSRVRTARDSNTFYGSRWSFGAPVPTYPAGVVVERQDGIGQTYLITRPGPSAPIGSFAAGTVFAPSAGLRITIDATGAAASVRVQLNAPAAVAAVAPRRFSTKTPRITGSVRVGRTLEVKIGSWSPRPSYRYQWYAGGKKITKKATKKYFVLTSRQKGKRITVKVTARKSGYTTVTKTSRKTKKVAQRKR